MEDMLPARLNAICNVLPVWSLQDKTFGSLLKYVALSRAEAFDHSQKPLVFSPAVIAPATDWQNHLHKRLSMVYLPNFPRTFQMAT